MDIYTGLTPPVLFCSSVMDHCQMALTPSTLMPVFCTVVGTVRTIKDANLSISPWSYQVSQVWNTDTSVLLTAHNCGYFFVEIYCWDYVRNVLISQSSNFSFEERNFWNIIHKYIAWLSFGILQYGKCFLQELGLLHSVIAILKKI